MRLLKSISCKLLFSIVAGMPVSTLYASTEVAGLSELFVEWQAVSDDVLGKFRGGFKVSDGFNISFGIKSMVVVDGELISQNQLVIPSLNELNNLVELQDLSNAMVNIINTVQQSHGDEVAPGTSLTLSELLPSSFTSNFSDGGSVIDGSKLQAMLTQPIVVQSNGDSALGAFGQNGDFTSSTIIQNQQDNTVIQTYNILNIELDNIGTLRSHTIDDMIRPLY